MTMTFADFAIADTLENAQAKLRELGPSGFPVAGGTSFQYLSNRPGSVAVDISRIGLTGITDHDGEFCIGANTTLTDLVRYEADGWILDEIATRIPTHQIRNISTIAGNIARLFPWSEIPLGLLVLEATIVVKDDESRDMPASQFFAKRPSKTLRPGELVTEIRIPKVTRPTGFGYRKENVTNAAFGLMSAAAAVTLDGDTIQQARVAVGSAVPAPMLLPIAQQELEGQPANESSISDAIGKAVANVRWQGREGMTSTFGAHLANVIVHDALTQALQRARGEDA